MPNSKKKPCFNLFLFMESAIDYLNDWDQPVNNIGRLTHEERSCMLMSRQTITGWKITSKLI